MTEFATDLMIDAAPEQVWQVLADIGNIAAWNPGVVASHTTSQSATGAGATRHCDLGGKNYLDESVTEWVEGERLTMRIVGTNLPVASADIRFRLVPEGKGTRVTVSPIYRLKYGPLGSLMDALVVRRTYSKGMRALLRGLKRHVEASGAGAAN